ncbi:MAG: glycosyltransferase family 39 protein [Chitinophagaceae bacterium]|nr:glycosyltransferase family 39 protein [Chitinophagaceae bacterium]MCW5904786.1 glycosyltransferase family 39 protein [Chitinophagaceae bacterium]
MNIIKNIPAFFSSKNKQLLFVLIVVHICIAYYFIGKQNITSDEPSYIEYSKRWLHGKPERIEPLDDSKTPVISIVWLPRIVHQIISPSYQRDDFGRKDQQEGRYMMIIFSIATLIYLYKFCQLFQLNKWWAMFLFFIADPLIIAYAVLINSDLLSGLVLLATLYHLYHYLYHQSNKHFMYSCIWLATGLVTKHTFLFFIPAYWLMIVVTKRKIEWKKVGQFIGIVWLIINVWFYFHHSFKTLGSYHFQSNTFLNIQDALSFIKWLPIPVPETYLQSMDMLQYHAQIGGSAENTYPGVYILGNVKLHGGYWYYYLVSLWYKFPLSILMLLLIGIVWALLKYQIVLKKYWVLIFPVVYFFIVLSTFNSFQIGIRHLLIILPLLYVLLAVVIHKLLTTKMQWSVVALWLFMLISVGKYYTDVIPYTNELITNKAKVYEKLMDSNIDYGQGGLDAKYFLQQHTDYSTPTAIPQKGKYFVSMDDIVLHKIHNDTSWNWLIQHYEPIGIFRNVYLQYDVKE